MIIYRNVRNGHVIVDDGVGTYPFLFDKKDTNRSIKGSLRKWGVTTRAKVDTKRYKSVNVNLKDGYWEKI